MTAIPTHTGAVDGSRQLGSIGGRLVRNALVVGVVGVAGAIIVAMATGMPLERFLKSYLLGFWFILTISLGGLFFTLVQHVTKAGWSVTVRRTAEAIAANLIWIWVLFLPLLVLAFSGKLAKLYTWMDPDKVAVDALYQHKQGYLNVPFWSLRAVLFLGIWALLGAFYFRTSVAQDASGDKALSHRMQRFAPVGLLLFALTTTFAGFDWLMALEAHWFSTMFGVYTFAMSVCGFFATMPILLWALRRRGKLIGEVTPEHYQDLGKLLFGFGVVFHAYIGFSQFMLLWYANIPEATGWFISRITGPWLWGMILIAVGHFAIPFVLLVTKHTKRNPSILAGIAAWILVMHVVDLYLVIMPEVPVKELETIGSFTQWKEMVAAGTVDTGWAPSLVDPLIVVGFGGLALAAVLQRLRGCSLVPERDPRLKDAMGFENV